MTVTSHKNLDDINIIILVSECSLTVYYFLIFLHWIGCQSQEQIFKVSWFLSFLFESLNVSGAQTICVLPPIL